MGNFNIYFHKDFDGICSAAFFTEVIEKYQNFSDIKYIPVDYNIKNKWLSISLNRPNAVLDFLFHPDAEWWFDHHVSSFLNQELKNLYKKSAKQYWNIQCKSCPSLIRDYFTRNLPLFTNGNGLSNTFEKYKEWIAWSDKIDSADYSSANEIIDLKHPCLKLNSSLAIDSSDEYTIKLVHKIRKFKPEDILKDNEIAGNIKEFIEMQDKSIDIYKKLISYDNETVAYIDQTNKNIPFQRFLSYYFYPKADYTIGVYRKNNGVFSISIGKNPWKKFQSKNIGNICKRFGGGGRKDVGAINTDNRMNAIDISRKIEKLILN